MIQPTLSKGLSPAVLTPPETRESLIRRLPDAADGEAWELFVDVYGPLLFRLARSKGFQQADAEDFVQEALTAVSRAISKWVEREDRGPFRAWLFRIAQNLAINFLSRPKHQRPGTGNREVAVLLDELPARDDAVSQLFEEEYRRELFHWAADHVRTQVSEKQWNAFWLTSVDELAIDEVAQQLGMSTGGIYIARSRITKRIRDRIQNYEEQSR